MIVVRVWISDKFSIFCQFIIIRGLLIVGKFGPLLGEFLWGGNGGSLSSIRHLRNLEGSCQFWQTGLDVRQFPRMRDFPRVGGSDLIR